MKCLLIIIVSVFYLNKPVYSQSSISLEEYINTYQSVAMEHMRTYRIPASIKMAQAILESGFGNSDLASVANNHFGIKCHEWQGRVFHKDDDAPDECFRAYDDPLQSFKDHSLFLTGRSRYEPLFQLEITDYRAWARGLRKAGYATNPRYPQLLIDLIERNQLYLLDQKVVGTMPVADAESDNSRQGTRNQQENNEMDADELIGTTQVRRVFENNRIRYIYAREDDTPAQIAEDLGIWKIEIIKYNELEKGQEIIPGQIVYLQPKRRKNKQKFHVAKEGETVYSISQHYGIKQKFIYKRNALEKDEQPEPGQKIYLR
ncbi:MAG: glucosaminidase domain-containing protein [Bacteroidota bacterium]